MYPDHNEGYRDGCYQPKPKVEAKSHKVLAIFNALYLGYRSGYYFLGCILGMVLFVPLQMIKRGVMDCLNSERL